jgi:hypothetical protein
VVSVRSAAERAATAWARTRAIADAQRRVGAAIATAGLMATAIDISPAPRLGTVTRLHDGAQVPQIEVRILVDQVAAGELLRWAAALGVTEARIYRRPATFDVWLHHLDEMFALHWRVVSYVYWPPGELRVLPGIEPPWARRNGKLTDRGHLSVADLRATLAAQGRPIPEDSACF